MIEHLDLILFTLGLTNLIVLICILFLNEKIKFLRNPKMFVYNKKCYKHGRKIIISLGVDNLNKLPEKFSADMVFKNIKARHKE